jgi:hypothetical protein
MVRGPTSAADPGFPGESFTGMTLSCSSAPDPAGRGGDAVLISAYLPLRRLVRAVRHALA